MEIAISNFEVNILAVVISSVVYFLIGAIWYSPALLGKQWAHYRNLPEEFEPPSPSIYVLTFALQFIACFSLAIFVEAILLGATAKLITGAGLGAAAGAGFILSTAGVTSIYDDDELGFFLINNVYHVVGLAVAGMIIVAM